VKTPSALVPVAAARLVGFAALASLGALEWQRMVAGLSSGRALLWAAAATAAGAALIACDRLPPRRAGVGVLAIVVLGLLAAVVVSGIDLGLLRPAYWDDLVDGVAGGLQSLGTVRLPYAGADPWPRAALQLSGAVLLLGAALVACWPRPQTRGYPFLSLAALLVLVVAPVISLGGTRPLLLGAAIAALTVCFLWLERLPLRPGVGVAALLGVALAGALPLAAVADRGEPWFDYKAFAEGLGPDDPVRFDWSQGYGPIDWPRDGNEVMRVRSDKPYYWKVENLERFDGREWADAGPVAPDEADVATEIRPDWRDRPGWYDRVDVSVRRMRTADVPAPGAIMSIESSTRPLQPAREAGRWTAVTELRRGDSYRAEVYTPTPSPGELRAAEDAGFTPQRASDLVVTVPFLPDRRPTVRSVGGVGGGRLNSAAVHFRGLGDLREPYVAYPAQHRTRYDAADETLRRSLYRRTWELAQQLRTQVETPFEYVLAVDGYLSNGFGYSERPPAVPVGRAPLDAFLFDSREGYCQHFAGAMALLLRMGGVPARVATGFSPGGFSKRRDAWIVRDTDAHAWVEAWFDELGWVTFDPTPDSTPARSQIAALEAPPPPTPSGGSGGSGGTGGGSGGPGARGDGLRPDLLFDVQSGQPGGAPGAAGGGGMPWWGWALVALAATAILGLAVAGWRRRRRLGNLPPLERSLAELEAALRRAGRPLTTGTTLRQLERSLGAPAEATAYLRALSASRYGPAPRAPTAAERRALRRALAQGLGVIGRLRAFWALPPRPR
jgi:transglutaminase-like putative cysteine protease